jgi:hypothetical protein
MDPYIQIYGQCTSSNIEYAILLLNSISKASIFEIMEHAHHQISNMGMLLLYSICYTPSIFKFMASNFKFTYLISKLPPFSADQPPIKHCPHDIAQCMGKAS